MAPKARKRYELGEFFIEPHKKRLTRNGVEVHLANLPFRVLVHLVENRDRLVSRSELLEKYWSGRDVYDDALRKSIGAVRKVLDDHHENPTFIETRWAGGYRYIGPFREVSLEKISGSGRYNGSPIHEIGSESELLLAETPLNKSDPAMAGSLIAKLDRNRKRAILAAVGTLSVFFGAAFLAYFRMPEPAVNNAAQSVEPKTAARPSIAVLPIRNLTGDPANDYLSDGFTESLINGISLIGELKVVSRGSAFEFKDKDLSASEIGKRLSVDRLLEGGLRLSGDRLRVNVRLVNANDGGVVWTYDSEQDRLEDILTIQDSITCQIITELKVKLCGELPPATHYTKNVKAYQLYLKGSYYRNRPGGDSLKQAIVFFEKALVADPKYALAHEGLAGVYIVMESNSNVAAGTGAPKAEFHARKALELDDTLAGAYLYLGVAKTINTYDIDSRITHYREALARNPNYRTAHLWLANDLTVQGKFDEAEREILSAQELDPLSFGIRLNLAELYFYWRKPDQVIEHAKIMLEIDPDYRVARGLLAKAYLQKGDLNNAVATMEELPMDDPNRIGILTAAGRLGEAKKIIAAAAAGSRDGTSPFAIACMYAASGDRETAFVWLERSYSLRQADLLSIKIEPALADLRNDPRYQDLLRRINLSAL